MGVIIMLAAKSLLIAGGVLLLLKLAQKRSAADRSLIAHLGLTAILLLPVAALALPALEVQGPGFLTPEPALEIATAAPAAATEQAAAGEAAAPAATFPGPKQSVASAPVDWAFWGYAVPAGLLLLLTLIALGRLFALKARAQVLVDSHWLSALAHAQRRMNFKHGTALLTSDDLPSPISWGLMRPVILLNSDATKSKREAEAIIAHELAHVASLDWAKLLLSRVTVALFWFNPLVWVLAREAHQLREEAADDAVLQSDIEDTDYANLLVGVARHECRGLLIGAHGVAPGRNSLSRRVRRVLDSALARAPGGWRWTSAAAFFAAGMAVPLATLHFVPVTPASAAAGSPQKVAGANAPSAVRPLAPGAETATIAQVASTAVVPNLVSGPAATVDVRGPTLLTSPSGATISNHNGHTVLRQPNGGTITVYPPDSKGKRRTVLTGPNGATIAYADARAVPGLAAATATAAAHPHDSIDRAIEMKAVGATPNYAASIRAAAPHLRLDHDDLIQLAALGVSPAYLRELAGSGYPNLNADTIVEARALGITGAYIRSITAAGYGRVSMDQLVELKAIGVTAHDIDRYRRAYGRLPSIHKVVELKAIGVDPEDLRRASGP